MCYFMDNCHQYGGRAQVRSEFGEGATFVVELSISVDTGSEGGVNE